MAKKPKKKVPKNVHDAAVTLGKRAWVANPGMKKMKAHAKDKRKKKVQHHRFFPIHCDLCCCAAVICIR